VYANSGALHYSRSDAGQRTNAIGEFAEEEIVGAGRRHGQAERAVRADLHFDKIHLEVHQ
jgi:hypothetical protein